MPTLPHSAGLRAWQMIEWDDSNQDIEPDKLGDAHHDALAAIAL
jgi:hypothetical protein